MIDELVKAANAIERGGIKPQNLHKKLTALPKKPCFRVWLTEDGHIHDIEPLAEEMVSKLLKYEPDNGKSLPGFNVNPLYRVVKTDDEIKATKGKAGEKLKLEWTKEFLSRDFENQKENDFWDKTRDLLFQCFGRVYSELSSICSDNIEDNETLHKFFNAVRQINVEQFQADYCNVVRRKIETGELPLSLMIYFVTKEKKLKEDADSKVPIPNKVSVFLDIKNYTNYPVASSTTISRLNAVLMKNFEKVQSSFCKSDEKDAYGLDAQEINDKFPRVSSETLSPLGGRIILRSQANTTPAQKRYHQCESGTFPVGSETRKRVKSALEWISNPERNGATYGIAGDQELLFAYPTVLPVDKIPLAKLFGTQKDDLYLKEVKFEQLSKSVIEQLKGLGKTPSDAQLEIFSLRKMDKARTKVVYYRNATVESLEEASTVWHEGCQNIPLLGLRDWSEKKDESTGKSFPVAIENVTVFPIKLHRYLNTVWKRDGEQAGKVKIFEPTNGLCLLLDQQNEGLVVHMMERFMHQAQGYFLTLCRSTGKHEIASLPDKKIYPGILGLLLCKLGKKKEDYMKESAFLLGRCLRITDEIHRLYCEVVRKKDLPPELCGSSLLVSMMESPVTTLSQLAMRSAPYIKWAKGGGDKGDKGGLVWYWLKQWEETADQLHTLTWPKRLIPEERAQIFLGYLASFPKSEKPNDNQTDSDNTNKQGDER